MTCKNEKHTNAFQPSTDGISHIFPKFASSYLTVFTSPVTSWENSLLPESCVPLRLEQSTAGAEAAEAFALLGATAESDALLLRHGNLEEV